MAQFGNDTEQFGNDTDQLEEKESKHVAFADLPAIPAPPEASASSPEPSSLASSLKTRPVLLPKIFLEAVDFVSRL